MGAVLLGALGLVVLLWAARGFLRANPHALALGLRIALVFVCVVAGVALFATGKFPFIILPLGAMASVFALNRQRRATQTGQTGGAPRAASGAMTRAEALSVLGLNDSATEADILAAYRKLIIQNHPDHGGSTYLAAKINQAKDVLLGK